MKINVKCQTKKNSKKEIPMFRNKTKKFTFIIAMVFVLVASLIPTDSVYGQSASAEISNVKYQKGSSGVTVTFTLQVHNLRNKTVRVCLWMNDAFGREIRHAGTISKYSDPSGSLTSQKNATPRYDHSEWSSFSLYIPYNQFPRGTYNVYPIIKVLYNSKALGSFNSSNFIQITGTAGNSDTKSNTGGSPQDRDGDGISDQLELWIAQNFMPVYEYDEEEHKHMLDDDVDGIKEFRDVIFLYQVSPVRCYVHYLSSDYKDPVLRISSNGENYLLTVVALYEYDYLPWDPRIWSETDTWNHYGDAEAVRMCISDAVASRDSVEAIQLRRHGHTDTKLARELEWYGTHPYLYASEGKHATYISDSECKGGAPWYHDLGWREDCAGGEVIRPTVRTSLNVGEKPSNNIVTTNDFGDSSVRNIFPGEVIWSPYMDEEKHDHHFFCGGYMKYFQGPKYPWTKHTVVRGFYDSATCGYSISLKWWPRRY